MPRSNTIFAQNTFARGLITEATGLNFPENALWDAQNVTVDRKGAVLRRSGFGFEQNYSNTIINMENRAVTTFTWTNVAGDGDISFVVVQIGETLHFYKVNSDTALSAEKHATTIDLNTYASTSTTPLRTLECQFSSGNGLLFVSHPRMDTIYITHDPVANTLVATEINVEVRDLEGDTADALDVDERPTSTLAGLTAAHRYNLENQGWNTTLLTEWDAGGSSTGVARTDMPSNADVPWYFKNSSDDFDFDLADDYLVGNSPAPKGKFIFSLYDINRDGQVAGATGEEIADERLSTTAFFAGRLFYSGLAVSKHSSKVFFSQIVERKAQYGSCYQTNDPTSETLFALLPSDGGVIDISEAGKIIKLFPMLNSLLVFSTNGVWAITGSQGIGFTANDYAVSKISSVPSLAPCSFVNAEGTPYWWNETGIYTVGFNAQSGGFQVVSVSEDTIKSFYAEEIPFQSKKYAKGIYDDEHKRIQWVYRDTTAARLENLYNFNSVLNMNIETKAFYPWRVNIQNVTISSIVHIPNFGGVAELTEVIAGADNVINGTDNVVSYISNSGFGIGSATKYLIGYNYSDATSVRITFGETKEDVDDRYVDWLEYDNVGQDYSGTTVLVTGYYIRGEAIREFQTHYINIISDNSVENGYRMRGRFDYAVGQNNAKRGSNQSVHNTDTEEFGYKSNRLMVRGIGRVCQFEVRADEELPFRIVGWAVFDGQNRWV